ncbi:MAG: SMP-30/gluconolactonase/LRE family protein [Cyclobacteriaceae bacterium]|nr:SMP-30/gluconolactonase/LRE family protein [Cyclobacteriaceae bacterium SS2]
MIQKYYPYVLILIMAIGFASCTKNPQKGSPQVREKTDRYQGLRSDIFTGEMKVETRIEDEQVFTEGPAVDSNGIVYFTNIRVNKILKWDPNTKNLSVFNDASNEANGLRFDPVGNLLICEGGSGKVTKVDMKTGVKSTIAESYNGKGLQSPNDLEYDSSGRIYFSSRTNDPDLAKENVRGLYRVDPDGSVHQLLGEPEVHMPNGVVISPDEKKLYLIEAHPDENHARHILSFDLQQDGSLANRDTLYNFYPGRSGDGMCIDSEGNLYVAAGLHETRGTSETLDTKPGIHVISPEGKLLAYVETPEGTVTNCTFGGEDLKTLYITCGTYLMSIRTKIAGKASYTY